MILAVGLLEGFLSKHHRIRRWVNSDRKYMISRSVMKKASKHAVDFYPYVRPNSAVGPLSSWLTWAWSGTDWRNSSLKRELAVDFQSPTTEPSFENSGLWVSLSVAVLVSPRSAFNISALSMSSTMSISKIRVQFGSAKRLKYSHVANGRKLNISNNRTPSEKMSALLSYELSPFFDLFSCSGAT